ncbi:MAG: 30S ribosomal protein S17 [SAR324 cluster bacterium]|nr:30S ribosomal protein S17 [SAR324 cluster bacterium]
MEQNRKVKKVKQGIVVSNKMERSIVVRVETTKKHPLYNRTMLRSEKYMAHDEENVCKEGDVVRIIECKPISSKKRWRLLDVVKAS